MAGAEPSDVQILYAAADAQAVVRDLRFVAITSMIIAFISLLVSVAAMTRAVRDLNNLASDRIKRSEVYPHEFLSRHRFDTGAIAIFGSMAGTGYLLLWGGAKLYRFQGTLMLRLYIVTQMLASIALAAICTQFLFNSPAGMIFYFGVIPGAIACIYPVILIFELTQFQNRGYLDG